MTQYTQNNALQHNDGSKPTKRELLEWLTLVAFSALYGWAFYSIIAYRVG